MKKALTQTIIVFVAVNLITAGFALAQNVTEEESQPASKEAVVAEKEIELERKKAEIEAKVAQKEAEIAAKVAQKGAEIAAEVQKQVELVQKQVELQIPKIELAIPRVSIPAWQHSGGRAVIVIPAAELKVEDLAAITEDMTVMSRIFDNKLSQANLTTGRASLFVGFTPFSGHNSGTIEAIFLEDFGALFLMKVNILLSPQPEAPEEKETEEEDNDPLWTQMRQEIYTPEEVGRRRSDDRPEEKYDAEKVEEMKETLTKTLKHAANIRGLKPDQSVILTVIGGQSQSGMATVTQSYIYGRSTGRSRRVVLPEPGVETGSFLPTVLTICVKKSDIDAFAKGELSFDQFRERTRIFTSYAKVGKEGSPGLEGRPVAHEEHSVF
ncbi:MAG TPA: hypothetical protein VMW72_23685 [Sedimentisphaerales bacterium]|nr:hypothetical protein [Sedimentisphaerales bacterium]